MKLSEQERAERLHNLYEEKERVKENMYKYTFEANLALCKKYFDRAEDGYIKLWSFEELDKGGYIKSELADLPYGEYAEEQQTKKARKMK